jgi:hypothetical protein
MVHTHGIGSAHAHSARGLRSRCWRGPWAQRAACARRAGLGWCGAAVIPRSEKEGTKPLYVCPGCSNHTYSNNMITRIHVQQYKYLFISNDPWVQRKLHTAAATNREASFHRLDCWRGLPNNRPRDPAGIPGFHP